MPEPARRPLKPEDQLDLLQGDQAEAVMVLDRQIRLFRELDVTKPGWVGVPAILERLQARRAALVGAA